MPFPNYSGTQGASNIMESLPSRWVGHFATERLLPLVLDMFEASAK